MTPNLPPARTSDRLLGELKQLHPLLIDLSLDRIRQLLAKLGHPERRLPPVIHIAGTNGKGSTVAFLKAMAEASGLRTHAYISPHLVRFHERISLASPDGRSRPIEETALVELLGRVAGVNDGAPMTFFEITTAAAFVAFAEHPADVVVLETGLGGDFDATNVVDRPALTIITPISMDHADKLGATIAAIASTKAGILKPDVPAVISRQEPEALEVIRQEARKLKAPLMTWDEDFTAFEQAGRLLFQSESELLDLPLPALAGPHQIVNAGAAVAAAIALRSLGFTDAGIASGLKTAAWPARFQRLQTSELRLGVDCDEMELWLDGGHNPAGGRALAETVAALEERSSKPLHLVVGMMGQKDAQGFLAPFVGQVAHVWTVPIPGAHEQPFDPVQLAQISRQLGMPATTVSSVRAALDEIAFNLRDGDAGAVRVLICGSLYLAGNVLSEIERNANSSGAA